MAELERVKRRIKNAVEMQTVVKIMKAISSANIQQYEEYMRSINEYNKTIELGMQIVLSGNKKIIESRIEAKGKGLEQWSSAQSRDYAASSMKSWSAMHWIAWSK